MACLFLALSGARGASAQSFPIDLIEDGNPLVGSFTEARLGSDHGLYPNPTVWNADISGATITLTGVTLPDVPGSLLSPGLVIGDPGTLVGTITDRGDGTFRISLPVSVSYTTTDGFAGTLDFDLQTSDVAPGSAGATIAAGCGGYASDQDLFGEDWNPTGTGDLVLVGHDCYELGASGFTRAFQVRVVANTTGECGDGAVNFGEQCDDGNMNDGDCCPASCQFQWVHPTHP